MTKTALHLAIIALLTIASAAAQSVVIKPNLETYRRPHPISEYKKTFAVNRPVINASTPALSKKIADAVSYENLLGLNIKEELGEVQWLEAANFEVKYNKNGLLGVSVWMEGSGAYPSGVTKSVVVDTRTGRQLIAGDVFIRLTALAQHVRKLQRTEVQETLRQLKKDPEYVREPADEYFQRASFVVSDLNDFSISEQGVTFHYDYGFPHVIQAWEPGGEYKMTWKELAPFIKPGGLLARFVR
jgi:hypothetical protein